MPRNRASKTVAGAKNPHAFMAFMAAEILELHFWAAARTSVTETVRTSRPFMSLLPRTQTSVTWSRVLLYTMCVTGSNPGELGTLGSGHVAGPEKATEIMSASLPTVRLPVTAPIPKALAPLRVAIRSALAAGTALASLATALARTHAVFISAIMSSVLLEDAPSVPMATLTPARWRSATRQKPLASLRLLTGQWTTEAPAWLHQEISSSVRQVMCTARSLSFRSPSLFRLASGVHFSSLRWQLEVLFPAALSRHSASVSCKWMCSGTPSRWLSAPPLVRVASEQVYGA
mmetsp:Transcript_139201/g.388416  ORF Transcript_139201/g.388416 Transcript_139201/m.388416 type:complete len:289 (-) Transcript_139201:639-1505(-)